MIFTYRLLKLTHTCIHSQLYFHNALYLREKHIDVMTKMESSRVLDNASGIGYIVRMFYARMEEGSNAVFTL